MTITEYKALYDTLNNISKMHHKGNSVDDNRIAFKIAKAITSMEGTIKAYNDSMTKVKETYAKNAVDDGTGTLIVNPVERPAYFKELSDLALTEVEPNDIPTFKFKFSVLARNYELTAEDWKILMDYVEDDYSDGGENLEESN